MKNRNRRGAARRAPRRDSAPYAPIPRWIGHIDAPCDPAVFQQVLAAWADGLETPVPGPAAGAGPGLYLTDVPMNRAGLAATGFMRKNGIEPMQAYLWRCMHFGELLRHAPTHGLAVHVRPEEVSTVLLSAAARAKLATTGERAGFDMVDVVRLVREAEAGEAAA